jgi:hypothetical protein
MGKVGKKSVGLTTTLSKRHHNALEQLAQKYDIKLACFVRKSVKRLLEQQTQNQSIMLADLQGGRNGQTT